MNNREKKKLLVVFIIVFLFALIADVTGGELQENFILERGELGTEGDSVVLRLDAGELLKDYEYELVIEPVRVTREEAYAFFKEAEKEIEEDFTEYEERLPIKETYISDLVEADWQFVPFGYVDSDGVIIQEQVPDEGILLNVSVTLACGSYEEMYGFPVFIKRKELTEQEKLLSEISQRILVQMQQEGNVEVQLPEEIEGVALSWSEKRDSMVVQVLFLEIIAVALITILRRKEQKEYSEKRKKEMEYVYSDVVNQLCLLLESGMTMRQAWQRIAVQYSQKKRQKFVEENPVYEAILHMSRRLSEGESERVVYEAFAQEVDIPSYRRLMRSLISNLEKGSSGLCNYLEEEEQRAYSEKILLAKKLGEEASTKMLMPLMLMMVLVMAVVIAPAMIGFLN